MGGLLKFLTIKWVSKREVRKSLQSRKEVTHHMAHTFSCVLMLVLPPKELSKFRPPILNIYSHFPDSESRANKRTEIASQAILYKLLAC